MEHGRQLSRKDFLRFFGLNMLALALPKWRFDTSGLGEYPIDWPWISRDVLPSKLLDILSLVPKMVVDQNGYLVVRSPDGRSAAQIPVAQTQWNAEHSNPGDRLYRHLPWGIVLHWYGDKENFDRSVPGYLRGFDSLRKVDTYITRTSAHFLVGDSLPLPYASQSTEAIGILQTQIPDKDGTPFVASHLMPLNYQAHEEKKQYFVRALYHLRNTYSGFNSVLQDFYDGAKFDPNMRTIAIEITGYDFENLVHFPSEQQIANVLSVVWAVMKRYGIPASDLMGHNEIQLGKADPGKKFMALVRFLIGAKALIEKDEQMCRLIFGQFLGDSQDPVRAVRRYFEFVRDYLLLVGTRRTVYEWEAIANYWSTYDRICLGRSKLNVADQFCWPISGQGLTNGYTFLNPNHHEGVDIYSPAAQSTVYLVANGKCVFIGDHGGHSQGKLAMFRHRQPDGAEIVSIYCHLSDLGDIQIGNQYPIRCRLGRISRQVAYEDPFLHFAIAYGATWDADLKINHNLPLNAATGWIQDRYLNPNDYLRYQVETKNVF
ncbi:MAG: hypothetical protein A2Y53_09380 [Chloroflexi bacterium RBG_16_47_49]|nr:MAG: hypothetical protein A2Y53_09380 [Chloroflexi bacterium RBG_16_47_49]